MDEFAESDFHTQTVINSIEKHLGRKLVKGKDVVKLDYVDREDKDGQCYAYGAVICNGDVYGFLEVDYHEQLLRFIPGNLILPV